MSGDKYHKAIRDKINGAHVSSSRRKTELLDMDKFKELYWRKGYEARRKLDIIAQRHKMVEKRTQDESHAITFITQKTKRQMEKIQDRNDEYRKLQDQMEEMTKSLEERVETLEQKKVQYLEHLEAYKPCKDLMTAVAKRWPTVVTEFELLQRLETLIKQKMRFSDEYRKMNQLHGAERQKLLYEATQSGETGIIILSNKLDELEQELKDVTVAIQKEVEKFNRIMDTSSEVENALSELRLGCLRLHHLTQPKLKIMDPFEQLSIVLEFGQLLSSVAESLEKAPQT